MPHMHFEMSTRIYGQWWNVIKQTVKRQTQLQQHLQHRAVFGNYQHVFSFPSTQTTVIIGTSSVKLHGVKATAGCIRWKLRVTQCFRLTFMITTDLRYVPHQQFGWLTGKEKKCYRNADIRQPWILWNHLSPRFSVPKNALVVQKKNANITTHTATPKEVSELLCNVSGAMEGVWRKNKMMKELPKHNRRHTVTLWSHLLETTRFQTTVQTFHMYLYQKEKKITANIMLAYVLFQKDWNNIIAVKHP